MKKCRVFIAILGVLACVGVGRAAEDLAAVKMTRIGALAWTQANLAALQSFGYSDVAQFLGALGVEWYGENIATTACPIGSCENFHMYGFTWADLAGDGHYRLVVVFQELGTSGQNRLAIYSQNDDREINKQSLVGQDIRLEGASDMPKVIQDINGDGHDELIIPRMFYDPAGGDPASVWPAVYRQEGGAYIEASRDFPKFYDEQVLPRIGQELQQATKDVAALPKQEGAAPGRDTVLQRRRVVNQEMVLIMTRDKILRVLGRDPTAGLTQARAWIAGTDARPAAAYRVIKDIGDHEADLDAAKRAILKSVAPSLRASTERRLNR